jgi:hypothetical protein
MGLTMREKRSVSRETAQRYRRKDRKGKQQTLDEFCHTTGYHRKYAIHLLSNWGRESFRRVDGRVVRLIVGKPARRKRRIGRRLYNEAVRAAVRRLWGFFDYMCGKRLAVLIRLNAEVLHREPSLDIDATVKEKLLSISPATIDRILSPERAKLRLKGRSHTRAGTLLKHQIPIRTFFEWDERRAGFFECDTVAHDGGNSSGEYCYTLNATDVSCGWVELRALPNRAHRWVKEQAENIRKSLPFPMKGLDSDNGGEFINHQLIGWAAQHHITFTRARPYRKNDNCFVEQKNDLAVRHTVGYYRFDTPAEYQALGEVYKHLCPLLNFYYPSGRIIQKTRVGSQVKKKHDAPTTPYQRLMDCPDVQHQVKEELRRRAAKLHLVKQKQLVDQAVAKLMHVYQQKSQGRLPLAHAGITEPRVPRVQRTARPQRTSSNVGKPRNAEGGGAEKKGR